MNKTMANGINKSAHQEYVIPHSTTQKRAGSGKVKKRNAYTKDALMRDRNSHSKDAIEKRSQIQFKR